MDPSPSAAEAAATDAWPESPSRLARAAEWLRPALVVSLLGFSAFVVFGNVLPTRRELAATQIRLEELRAENDGLRRRIAELDARSKRLEKDPWATERILRDELKMSGDDEVIVR
jgi:cell division protein FtsB